MSTPRFIDVHTHTQFAAYDQDRDVVIRRALDAGIWMVKPFLPDTPDKILDSLGVASQKDGWSKFSSKEASHLFPRIK